MIGETEIVGTETRTEKSVRRKISAKQRLIAGAGSSKRDGVVAANLRTVEEVLREMHSCIYEQPH